MKPETHRWALALASAAAALVAGCSEERPPAAPARPAASAAVTPPTANTPDYVGRWAVSLAGCQTGGWEFRKDSLGTAGEVSCQFKKVTQRPDGYAIDAQCAAQAPPELKSFTLSFAGVGPAQTMTVDGGPWSGPVALVRCPP